VNQREELENLYKQYASDPVFADLRQPGIELVPGRGPLNPDIMLIGEAPGEMENANRLAFVGKAGNNLTMLLQRAGIDPYNVFLTNVVKYWPKSPVKYRKRINKEENFTYEEADASDGYLQEEIRIVAPKIVGLLGRFPLQAIYPEKTEVFRDHGLLLDDKYVVLYHPAVLNYDPSPTRKALLQGGYNKLKEYLDERAAVR